MLPPLPSLLPLSLLLLLLLLLPLTAGLAHGADACKSGDASYMNRTVGGPVWHGDSYYELLRPVVRHAFSYSSEQMAVANAALCI